MAHTPTPWKMKQKDYADKLCSGFIMSRASEIFISHSDKASETWTCTGLATPEGVANAEFIVQACNAHDDLVKACETSLENLLDLDPPLPIEKNLIKLIEKALANAKGN